MERDVHQRTAGHPLLDRLDGLRERAAVQRLVQVVDHVGEDPSSVCGDEDGLRGGGQVGADPVLEVEGEVGIREEVRVPAPGWSSRRSS